MYNWMPGWYLNLRYPILLFQTICGMLLFSWRMLPRTSPKKIVEWSVLGMLLCWGETRVLPASTTGWFSLMLQCLILLSIFLLSILIEYKTFQVRVWTAVFVASSGYAVQNIAGSVKTLLRMISPVSQLAAHSAGVVLLDIFCYGSVYTLAGIIVRPHIVGQEEIFENKYKALFSAGIMVLCIGMGRLSMYNTERTLISQGVENVYAILTCVLILVLQFGLMEHRKMRHDVDAMRQLLHEQYVQYENGKTNMQLVNEKYHDLKQLLQTFKGQVPPEQLETLEQKITCYDANIHTGNDVLDIILSEKRMVCIQNNIQLTCYVGGADLGFVEELDLYSLFNNILNNAIEAVQKLPLEWERFVTLTGQREGNMVTIHAENPCEETIEFVDGLPQSPRDPNYHGFGMRSMEHIAERYNGSLAAEQKNHMFYLDILLFA